MELAFDMAEIEGIASALDASEAQVNTALSRTIRRVTASIKSRFGKELAGIAMAKLGAFQRARVKARIAAKGKTGVVWVGLEPVSLAFLSARQVKGGVKVRNLFIPNAFIVEKIGSKAAGHPVFLSAKHSMPEGIVEDKRPGLRGSRRLAYSWGALGEVEFQKALRVAEERLPIEFERELKHEISK